MNEELVIDGQGPAASQRGPLAGNKGTLLAALREAAQNVPPFYCVTTEAFRRTVAEGGSALFGALVASLCSARSDAQCAEAASLIRRHLVQLPLSPEIERAIREAHSHCFGERDAVAVRSSVTGEDGRSHSFAGMHDTVLGVRGLAGVIAAVRRVWASAYSDRAVAYRRQRKLSLEGIAPAVVVQQMVAARSSGVLFTCDPATGNVDEIVISVVAGLGEALVGGDCAGETYFVDKRTRELLPRRAPRSESPPPGGPMPDDSRETGAAPLSREQSDLLSPARLRNLVGAATAIECHFGRPQDIEFCFDDEDRLYILQSRDVVDPAEYGPAAGNHLVWDNSNIIESYSGATTPMTFSFIRRAYTIVYHCFAEVMGISPRVVHANRGAFENMLGLFRGRVYYNLKNWYALVRLFPGYKYNSPFMESMMGLKDPLAFGPAPAPPARLRRWFVELPALARLLARSAWNFARIETIVGRFQEHFDLHYAEWSQIDFRRLKPHELHELYGRMEQTLLWNWKAPIINDFYVMVFYGILKKLCRQWCADESGALSNGLVCGEEGVESAEPAMLLISLATMARDDPALRELIVDFPEIELPRLVTGDTRFKGFAAAVRRYLDRYGLRSVHELKLEEDSFRDQPHLLYRLIRNYLTASDPAALDVEAMTARRRRVRSEAEKLAGQALGQSRSWLPRKWVLARIVRNARRGIRNRETMRLARTRIYGILREMLRAMGEHLAREGILDEAADIFYLTIDEVWDFVKGTAVSTDLRGLSRLRRREYDHDRQSRLPPPERRFDTYGMAYHRNLFRRQRPAETAAPDAPLMGIGCCPGVVVGQVAVVHDPNSAQRPAGEILVAERTDPGWVPLYPAFSGILIERGSVLSHSAIVARELGIPTIVAVTGLTARLESGRRVRMDGRAGTVEILADRVIGSGEQAKPAVVSASGEFVDLEIGIEEGPIASE